MTKTDPKLSGAAKTSTGNSSSNTAAMTCGPRDPRAAANVPAAWPTTSRYIDSRLKQFCTR